MATRILNKTKKQKKEMLQMLEQWLETYEQELNAWIAQQPEELKKSLDFSPESLLKLEPILWQRYATSKDVRSLEHQEDLNGVATYIGEVFKRNIPGGMRWVTCGSELKYDDDYYCFYWAVKSDVPNSFYRPSDHFSFIVHNKTSNELYSIFERRVAAEKEYRERKNKTPAVPYPGRGGSSHYSHFLLIDNDSYSLPSAKEQVLKTISKAGLSWKVGDLSERRFFVQIAEDYCFNFFMDSEASVLAESKEIAQSVKLYGEQEVEHPRERMAQCSTRIEFWGDEDASWDFGNDAIRLLEQFINIPSVHVYDVIEGCLFPA